MTSVLYFLSFSVKYLLTVNQAGAVEDTSGKQSWKLDSVFPTKSIAPIANLITFPNAIPENGEIDADSSQSIWDICAKCSISKKGFIL